MQSININTEAFMENVYILKNDHFLQVNHFHLWPSQFHWGCGHEKGPIGILMSQFGKTFLQATFRIMISQNSYSNIQPFSRNTVQREKINVRIEAHSLAFVEISILTASVKIREASL